MEIWDLVRPERQALVRDLKTLPAAEAWDTPSLCAGWSVRDVVAHMAATAAMTPPKFFQGFLGSGFSFEKFVAKGIAAERGESPLDTLNRFEALIFSTKAPPGPTSVGLGRPSCMPRTCASPSAWSTTTTPWRCASSPTSIAAPTP